MRKLILLTALMFTLKLFANPVMLPPVISEFYYNGGDWQIELYFAEEYQMIINELSDLTIISNADTGYFKDGQSIQWNTIMVITQNSLSTPFYINQNQDWVYLASSLEQIGSGISYGSNGVPSWFWQLTTPKPGESIVKQFFSEYGDEGFYRNMKESTPSIGYNEFNCSSRGSISGYVFDQLGNPIEGVKLVYCSEIYCIGASYPALICIETDIDGYFESDGQFCYWHIFWLTYNDHVFTKDTLFIEPDSVYYKEYTLTNVGIAEIEEAQDIGIYAAPNPFVNKTTFHISIPNSFIWQEAQITIRDNNGRIVDEIQISHSVEKEMRLDWFSGNAQRQIPSGMYLYSLEVDGKLISSQKMIITE